MDTMTIDRVGPYDNYTAVSSHVDRSLSAQFGTCSGPGDEVASLSSDLFALSKLCYLDTS